MAFLTDRTLATGVTSNDLIHIVITGDTSQNPAGSSYKATMGQVLDLINPTTITGGTYNPATGTITFYDDTGGTFDVTGLLTGYTNTEVTGFTYDNSNTFTIFENDGSTHSASINVVTGLTINGNLNVTGTIFSTGSTQFISTTGITISAVTLSTGTTYNGINYAGNVNLTIPSPSGFTGLKIIVKDESGNAGTYRIRLTPSVGTIDGNSYVDMNINYMSLTLVARNNNWWII
jgi:hypothetical protein